MSTDNGGYGMKTRGPLSPEQALKLSELKSRLKDVLVRHPGPARAISMVDLYRAVFQREPKTRINGTRELRELITVVQNEGFPVGTSQSSSGGGYYLIVAGSDLEGFVRKEKVKALKILKKIAAIRRVNVALILNEMQISLTADTPREA